MMTRPMRDPFMTDYESDTYALHRAAAAGDLANVERYLGWIGDTPAFEVNAPDDQGRSAIFYAQINGYTAVADLLEKNGWTRMPEGNLMRGPGGRLMWLHAGPWATPRPTIGGAVPRCRYAAPVALSMPWLRDLNRSAANKALGCYGEAIRCSYNTHSRGTIAERQERRKLEYSFAASNAHREVYQTVGPNHKLYMRKEAGYKSKMAKKPCLNTRDYAEAYAKVDAPHLLDEQRDFLDTFEDDVEVAMLDEYADAADEQPEDVPAERTVGDAAFFVVDRRPTRAADGTWVVVKAAKAELALVCGAAESTAAPDASLTAIPEDGGSETASWPALPAKASGLAALKLEWVLLKERAMSDASSFVSIEDDASLVDRPVSELDSELASLVDPDDLKQVEADVATTAPPSRQPSTIGGGVWSGAAATRAAVGFATGEPAAFRPPPAKVTLPTAAVADDASLDATVSASTGDDDAEDNLDLVAGLKDASHRARGSQRMSAKAVQMREASKAKKEKQRAG